MHPSSVTWRSTYAVARGFGNDTGRRYTATIVYKSDPQTHGVSAEHRAIRDAIEGAGTLQAVSAQTAFLDEVGGLDAWEALVAGIPK